MVCYGPGGPGKGGGGEYNPGFWSLPLADDGNDACVALSTEGGQFPLYGRVSGVQGNHGAYWLEIIQFIMEFWMLVIL